MGNGLLSVERVTIARDNRYVRQVGISNIGDLLLGLASSSCELSYIWILIPEYQIGYSIMT